MVKQPCDTNNAETEDMTSDSTLLHRRLGYISEKGMRVLVIGGRISELKSVKIGFCGLCAVSKQKRISFEKTPKTLKATKLELVHTDVHRPTSEMFVRGIRNVSTESEVS